MVDYHVGSIGATVMECDNSALEATRRALLERPADRVPWSERATLLAQVQAAADLLAPEDYTRYRLAWNDGTSTAGEMENAGVLGHLRRSADHAVAEFRGTRVLRGMALWLVYNMGCLVRTPNAAFGIDLSFHGAEKLVGDIDFLLTTHEHIDHFTPALLRAMIDARKPCFTRWFAGSTILSAPTTLQLGHVQVDVTIGDHQHRRPEACNNMLMFFIRERGGATLLHTGDNSNAAKLTENLRPDLFMFHMGSGLAVAEAVRRVDAKLSLPAHVSELEHSPHPPQAWRYPFSYARNTVDDFPDTTVPVLSWGERILAPGTELI
jgi:L-ascorbate metabolism protein UlaG (beta-lactamase superfamily)